MTTYQVTTPAAAQRYFEQSFVGDVAAMLATLGRKAHEFTALVSHYTRLAHAAETRH